MLELSWLKTFVELERLRHFGKTANELNMTQPNVSLHIKQLEQATRTKLIERTPFRLTQAGERLLVSARNTLMELQICQSDINAINELRHGTLTIAASDIISRLLLMSPLQIFKKEFPGIDITLTNTTSSQASELVKSAKADLGFIFAQEEKPPLCFTELQKVKWCAVGSSLNMWQQKLAKNKDDKPTLILLGHDTRTRGVIDLALPSLNLSNYRIMEVGSVDSQIDWAEAGFGIAIVPDLSLHSKKNLKTTITELPEFPNVSLGYIVRQNQILSRAIKNLLNRVSKNIGSC
ncbi:LysR family transcriptional regulator [Vibrio marisflavi]|uniref:HTH-type transcriptional regulator HdfR n=1 Tax=Vibrio marisflavi CECT 7928 TaxID=634439 RepID=A0ABN8DYB1_9VIBR|nr:LysR family transcriptional regulator [Vibrio marisflavi]CAH0536604.1 HTH-type transcriptional regulator HdfR [Vibrio marisflavi CECT 7928]